MTTSPEHELPIRIFAEHPEVLLALLASRGRRGDRARCAGRGSQPRRREVPPVTDRILAALAPIVSSKLEEEMKAGAIQYESRLFRELIAKGREEGERSLLERQLARRFGPLPTWARDELAAAHADLLETWSDRILDATRLEEALHD